MSATRAPLLLKTPHWKLQQTVRGGRASTDHRAWVENQNANTPNLATAATVAAADTACVAAAAATLAAADAAAAAGAALALAVAAADAAATDAAATHAVASAVATYNHRSVCSRMERL